MNNFLAKLKTAMEGDVPFGASGTTRFDLPFERGNFGDEFAVPFTDDDEGSVGEEMEVESSKRQAADSWRELQYQEEYGVLPDQGMTADEYQELYGDEVDDDDYEDAGWYEGRKKQAVNALEVCNACDWRQVTSPNPMGLCNECLSEIGATEFILEPTALPLLSKKAGGREEFEFHGYTLVDAGQSIPPGTYAVEDKYDGDYLCVGPYDEVFAVSENYVHDYFKQNGRQYVKIQGQDAKTAAKKAGIDYDQGYADSSAGKPRSIPMPEEGTEVGSLEAWNWGMRVKEYDQGYQKANDEAAARILESKKATVAGHKTAFQDGDKVETEYGRGTVDGSEWQDFSGDIERGKVFVTVTLDDQGLKDQDGFNLQGPLDFAVEEIRPMEIAGQSPLFASTSKVRGGVKIAVVTPPSGGKWFWAISNIYGDTEEGEAESEEEAKEQYTEAIRQMARRAYLLAKKVIEKEMPHLTGPEIKPIARKMAVTYPGVFSQYPVCDHVDPWGFKPARLK